jgi:hypothetical protein
MAEAQAPAEGGAMVTIDGEQFALNALPKEVQAAVAGVRACEIKIRQLQQELSMVQTARAAYARAVKGGLPQQETSGE